MLLAQVSDCVSPPALEGEHGMEVGEVGEEEGREKEAEAEEARWRVAAQAAANAMSPPFTPMTGATMTCTREIEEEREEVRKKLFASEGSHVCAFCGASSLLSQPLSGILA